MDSRRLKPLGYFSFHLWLTSCLSHSNSKDNLLVGGSANLWQTTAERPAMYSHVLWWFNISHTQLKTSSPNRAVSSHSSPSVPNRQCHPCVSLPARASYVLKTPHQKPRQGFLFKSPSGLSVPSRRLVFRTCSRYREMRGAICCSCETRNKNTPVVGICEIET